jgi:hypothetical protein
VISADSGYGYVFLPVAGAGAGIRFSSRIWVSNTYIHVDITRCHLYLDRRCGDWVQCQVGRPR